jgi:hypothetical protein
MTSVNTVAARTVERQGRPGPGLQGVQKIHIRTNYRVIKNDWNYEASCALTALPVSGFENFQQLNFAALI